MSDSPRTDPHYWRARAEEASRGRSPLEPAEIVTARAVAPLDRLAAWWNSLSDSQRAEDYPKDMAGRIEIAPDAAPGLRHWRLWTAQGAVPMSMTPEEFDKFLRGDIIKWADVVKKFPEKPQ